MGGEKLMNSKIYKLELDNKSLIIPEELRSKFEENILVCKALSNKHKNALFIFNEKLWKEFTDKLKTLSSDNVEVVKFKNYFLGSCYEIAICENRFSLPDNLARFLNIEDGLEKNIYVEYMPYDSEYRYSDYILWIE